MDRLILAFLDNKVEGESADAICKDVSRFFNLGNVRIEEHLDDMVDGGKLQCFHLGGLLRYAINQP